MTGKMWWKTTNGFTKKLQVRKKNKVHANILIACSLIPLALLFVVNSERRNLRDIILASLLCGTVIRTNWHLGFFLIFIIIIFAIYRNLLNKPNFKMFLTVGTTIFLILGLPFFMVFDWFLATVGGAEFIGGYFPKYVEKVIDKPVKYMVVDPVENQSYYKRLSRQVEEFGLKKNVAFSGFYNRKKLQALTRADVFLAPSLRETFGLSVLETMVLGKPIVVSDYGGFECIIEHLQNPSLGERSSNKALSGG